MNQIQKILTALCLLLCTAPVQAQRIAVKTNVAELAIRAYNLEGELTTGNRSTFCLGLAYGNRILGKELKVLAVQPEYRYWFNGRPMIREFVGLGLLTANYETTLGRKHYKGNAMGGGLTFGYVYKLTKRLNVEATAGFGLVWLNYKMNYTTDNADDVGDVYELNPQRTEYHILPTKIGLTLSYILK